jgi:hypothetical protein
MHSDITKEDIEHSRHFRVIVVLCMPYTQEVDYKGLKQDCHFHDLPHGLKYRVQSQVNTV